jgi:cytochrome c-type biogenesis protein CcmH/NrfG
MPEPWQLAIVALIALVCVAIAAMPLVRPRGEASATVPRDDDRATLLLRHRIALDGLRDVEADRRAGSLDDASYAAARREAEERATRTLADLEVERDATPPTDGRTAADGTPPGDGADAGGPGAAAPPGQHPSRRPVLGIAALLAALLAAGSLVPGAVSLVNPTVVNQRLAAAQKAEAARQATIARLQAQLTAKPDDPAALVQLAQAYLDGGTTEELNRAAVLLIAAIRLDGQDQDAYRLLITAYIGASDYTDATAATDAFAKIAPTSPDVAFFRGLIAYQGSGDRAAAVRWFDEFLARAPNDPRAVMIRSLRAEAAGQLPGSSSTPGASPGSVGATPSPPGTPAG